MKVERTAIDGVIIIKPDMHGDARGFFVETWQRDRYADAGIAMPFVQDNHSRSSRGILRGMHFQREHPQGKLVHVSLGAIFDVVVDIRPHSPTFGQWTGVTLDAGQQHQLWIPPGMATLCICTTNARIFTIPGMRALSGGMIPTSASPGHAPPPCFPPRTPPPPSGARHGNPFRRGRAEQFSDGVPSGAPSPGQFTL